jgi:tripartite-type tricarboxylate transporter receptor subunit TctC
MLALVVGIAAAGAVASQDYPNKPIRIITTAAGGGGDFTTRQVAQGVTGPLGQTIIVDNRASGFLAAEAVSKAPPDGYTLLVTGSAVWLSSLFRTVPYDVIRDFAPIMIIEVTPSVFAVHPSVPVRSVKELIALAKARPGEISYASDAIGGRGHLGVEMFKSMAGANIMHVPYKGSAAANTAVLSGEAQMVLNDPGVLLPHAKLGRLRLLAVTTATPSALAPGLPTVGESGLPGFELEGITGFFAPAKTPAAVITRLNQETVRALNTPEVKERFLRASVEVVASSPERLSERVKSDLAKFGKVVKDANVKVE